MYGNKIESRKYQKYKILIAYHSGSGSTRTISEILRDRLSNYYKVDRVIEEIRGLQKNPGKILKIPLPRWYSPVTGLFHKQIHGIDYSNYKKNLQVLEDRCTNCNICVDNCIRNYRTEGKDFPSINTSNCGFCLKCVHNCPGKAIVFTDRMKDSPRLDKSFYRKLKQKTFR